MNSKELQKKIAKEYKLDKLIKRAKWEKEFDESDNKRLEIVGSPYEEIQTLYDEGNEEQAYELYKKINKEIK